MSATVTFIHGLSNKPEASYLHELWKRKLAHEGFSLDDNGVLSSMVYWADVLYPSPDTDLAAYESAATGEEALNEARVAVTLATQSLPADEQKFIEQLSAKLAITGEDIDPATLSPEQRKQIGYERIPLPAWLRNRLMAKLVRDAHLYFFNKDFTPRSDATFRVRDELRKRFMDAVKAVKDGDRPVVVVSHSMGTIIAYDCLMHEPECPSIDGLVTIGSPLGLDEVQDFFPRWTRENGFPTRAPERSLGQCVRPARRRRRRRSGHRQRLPPERPRGGRGSGGTQLGRVAAQHQQIPARQEAPCAARADARGRLAMSSIDELVAAIQVATKNCAKGEAQAAIQAFAAMPAAGAAQPDETTAQSLLLGFNERRWFDLSAQLGQALAARGPMSAGMRQCYAQALVERGRLADARAQLELVVQMEDVAASERAEARGLIARTYKQEFIDQLRATSTASAPTLEQAVTTYLKEYKDDPPVRDWQGINAVALLALAQRQGLAAAAIADPKALAETHRQKPAGEARAHAVRRGHARGSIRGARAL